MLRQLENLFNCRAPERERLSRRWPNGVPMIQEVPIDSARVTPERRRAGSGTDQLGQQNPYDFSILKPRTDRADPPLIFIRRCA
jgi:hypothetical protein